MLKKTGKNLVNFILVEKIPVSLSQTIPAE